MEFIDSSAAEMDEKNNIVDNEGEDAAENLASLDEYEADFIDDSDQAEEFLPFNLGNSPSKLCLPSPKKKLKIPLEIESQLNKVAGTETQELLEPQDIIDFSTDFLISRMEVEEINFNNWTRNIKSNLTQISCWFLAGLEGGTHPKGKAILEAFSNRNVLVKASFFFDFFLICIEFQEGRRSRSGMKKICENVGLETFCIEAPNNRSVNVANLVNLRLRDIKEHQSQMKWIKSITLDPIENKFDLSIMVQWAITNNYTSQAEITYRYAKMAEEGDNNAKNWLASTSQVKYSKDCATQVRLMNTGELMSTSTKDLIIEEVLAILKRDKGGDYLKVDRWFYLQKINPLVFQSSLRHIIKGTMKKSTICLVGVPNSGKSTLVGYFLEIFKGRFISYSPSPSSFWLQPALGLKLIAIDDVPVDFWQYADSHLRPAFDGTQLTIDVKYQAPHSGRLPPIFLTTNVNVPQDDKMKYLQNRITFFDCPKSLLETIGNVSRLERIAFGVNDLAHWIKFYQDNLDLDFPTEEEEEDD